MASLALSLLKEHRWSYLGMFISVVVAGMIVSGSGAVLAAARAGDGVVLAGLDRNASAKIQTTLETTSYFGGLTAGISAFVVIFLVASTMGFVVDARRREFALLRLSGARAPQIEAMVLGEAFVLSCLGASLGAVISLALTGPYVRVLIDVGLAPPDLRVTGRPGVLLATVALMVTAVLVGAWAPARRIGRVQPIEALSGQRSSASVMSLTRWIIGVLAAAGTVVLLVLPVTVGDFQSMTLLLAAAAFLSLTVLAPVIIPAISRVLGATFMIRAPGAGLLAREHSTWRASRTASLATPVVLLVGLGGTLFMLAQTGQSANYLSRQDSMRAGAVVVGELSDSERDRAATLDGVEALVPYSSANDWGWQDTGRTNWPRVALTDPTALTEVVSTTVQEGSLDDVSGTKVASTRHDAHVGQSLPLEAPDGTEVAVTVVAVVQPTAFLTHDGIADRATFDQHHSTTYDRWFLTATAGAPIGQVLSQLAVAAPGAQVMTTRQWLEEDIASSRANQQIGLLAMIGGASILALVALAQTVLTSLRERRREFALLRTVGATRRTILATTMIETTITVATAGLLVTGVLAATYARMGQYLHHEGLSLSPTIPVTILAMLFALAAVVAITATAAGTRWALRTDGAGSSRNTGISRSVLRW